MNISKLLSNMLRTVADNIDAGNTNLSEEELFDVFEQMKELNEGNSSLSLYEACKYLNVSRATFYRMVAEGKIPSGKKRQGFNELSWKRSDLDRIR